MRWLLCALAILALQGGCSAEEARKEQQRNGSGSSSSSLWDCLFEANSAYCVQKQMAQEMDRIEVQVTGRSSDMPVSKVIEESGNLLANGLRDMLSYNTEDVDDEKEASNAGDNEALVEGRRKKFGKKKKKQIHKMMMVAMMIKAKLSLLLQLISTHLQMKFFVIAIIGLMINTARFWIELKKSHRPSKVIYYEHAQHQHHYDHDDDHGIWGRSSDESPQDLAYNGYVPEH